MVTVLRSAAALVSTLVCRSRQAIGLTAAAAVLAAGSTALTAGAQAPIALPYTATTVAGGAPTSTGTATTPVSCGVGSQYKSFDAFGDGCPGLQTNFSTDLRGGVASDGQGNIYIGDTSNNEVRKYDPKTTVVSRVAGKGTNCTVANGLLDSSGDGCPSLQTSLASTPRGVATDPYGNVLFAGYGTQMVHVVCMAASPLCPNTAGLKQVGSMYRVAGCVGTVGGTATGAAATAVTAGTEGDASFASPYSNLAGDATAGNTGTAAGGTCSNTVGILNQPRGVGADKYGNVYIAETGTTNIGLRYRVVLGPQTSTFFTGSNPLYGFLGNYSGYTGKVHVGYIYTILGGFTAPATGGACDAYTATDSKGDGCPFYFSSANGGQQAVAADDSGNVIFSDIANSLLRVLYAGGASAAANPMYAAILANNPGITPVAGNVYLLAGGSAVTTAPTATPVLGTSIVLPNQVFKVAVGPGGNLYLGDSSASQVFLYDVTTGYIRVLFKTGTPCAAHVAGSANGDGCPANTFSVSGSNGFGVAPDPLGNLYVADSTNALIRKIEAVSLIPTVVGSATAAGTPLTQTLQFHGPKGSASLTVSTLNNAADITVGTSTCAAPNADTTLDCSVPVTFAPTQPGTRTANLSVTARDGAANVLGTKVFAVSGSGLGTALVTDVVNPSVAASNGLQPSTAALDSAGNFYTVDVSTNSVIKANVTAGTSVVVSGGGAPLSPLQTAVDNAGNVYITSAGAATYSLYTLNGNGAYTVSTPSVSGAALPQGIAVDPSGNVYIADKTSGSVIEVAAGTAFNTAQAPLTLATGFTNPVGLALDGAGNLFVADQGLPGVYKIAFVNGVPTKTLYAAASGATITASLTPTAIAADAAGNVYVQDSVSKTVIALPVNQPAGGPVTTTVLGAGTVQQITPSGIAVDGNGVVYATDANATTPALRQVKRNALSFDFGTSTSLVFSGTITNAGNQIATGFQATGLDSAEFPLTSVTPTNCAQSTSITPGFACAVTTQFTPGSGTGMVASTLAYTPATSTTGFLTLTATKTGAAVTTLTTIGVQSPAAPVYSVAGTEVAFPITVAASDGSTATGAITISVDSGTPVPYTLTGGSVSVPLSGLQAGNHTVVASYASQAGLTGSTSTPVSFTIAQATVAVVWTPAATTQLFSAAVGTGVLNATATAGGVPVAGNFIYSATPASGTLASIHSASYLAIGAYSLGVTFVPNDTTDFTSGATASVPSYTVTKATTTAALGASQFVVAQDGTGNYTRVQDAINAVGAAGGSVYIKPGTYMGDVTVVQPNLALRGLGGDPNAVILTHAGGAFGGAGVYQYAGEFNTSQANGFQLPAGSTLFNGDEGSATLVVAKGVNTAFSTATLIPNNFYAENFTLNNTYNTDNTTTTTTYLPAANSGTCTAGQGPARTYYDLFNSSLLCASQALAIWTTSDLAVMNNIYTNSLQDTIYAGSQGSGSSGYVPARQYWFRGKVSGTVDYIFGDAAAVFDYSSIYTVPHGALQANGMPLLTGTATIEAQNKATQTGSTADYLSGYVMNSNVFTSYSAGQTGLELGRPYGTYSTWLLLNSYIDQTNPQGYIEFSGSTNNLPTSTYDEYNNIPYTDPATNTPDLNGVIYQGVGGSTGQGVAGPRETISQSPGTPMNLNALKTSMTQAQAQRYFPTNFLSTTVPAAVSTVANWNPTAALAASVNAFATGGTSTSVVGGTSVTILMRPQTPGLGAITNGNYTVPTGTYALRDTFNGATTTLASGTLDAAGEASYTAAALPAGSHSFTWTYSGDGNFSGSTSSAYALAVNGVVTTTTLSATANPITYGESASITASVAPAAGSASPTGTVTLTTDGTTTQTLPLTSGSATFTVTGLGAGTHAFTASYSGATTFNASATTSAYALTVNKANLVIHPVCANRTFGALNNCSATVTGYQYNDNAASVFTVFPTGASPATRDSPAGTYAATSGGFVVNTASFANYNPESADTTFTITGGAAQVITFRPLPSFPSGGTYQLAATASSGLPVTYTVTGPATVNGASLTVTGAGAITVTASQTTDPTGDYAPATAVSRSFVAQ